ncbi:MAG: ISAzo13-like element transposase-related protein, partial [Streptosporangiaceae bacterium]
ELISATTTTTGLTVHAELDTSEYATGLAYTKKQVDALPITRHAFHGDWNYTVRPEPHESPIPAQKRATRPRKAKLFFPAAKGLKVVLMSADGTGPSLVEP